MKGFLAALLSGALVSLHCSPAAACQASYYGAESGTRTASGARFKPMGLSLAHPSWAFGTWVQVCYKGRCARAVVNDRGPAGWTHRCADLSHGLARLLGMEKPGVGDVSLTR